VRQIYLRPDVTDEFDVTFHEPDLPGIRDFLCKEHEFSQDRVKAALDRAFGEPTLF
jgi:flap endonuclease-1